MPPISTRDMRKPLPKIRSDFVGHRAGTRQFIFEPGRIDDAACPATFDAGCAYIAQDDVRAYSDFWAVFASSGNVIERTPHEFTYVTSIAYSGWTGCDYAQREEPRRTLSLQISRGPHGYDRDRAGEASRRMRMKLTPKGGERRSAFRTGCTWTRSLSSTAGSSTDPCMQGSASAS